MTEKRYPTAGGSYRREKDGGLKVIRQPNTTTGTGPRNAQGKPINTRHQVLDPETGRPVEKRPAADATKPKKGGE